MDLGVLRTPPANETNIPYRMHTILAPYTSGNQSLERVAVVAVVTGTVGRRRRGGGLHVHGHTGVGHHAWRTLRRPQWRGSSRSGGRRGSSRLQLRLERLCRPPREPGSAIEKKDEKLEKEK